MKDLISWLSAITLLQGAIAIPHGAGSKFNPIKRDADVEYITVPSEYVVWVNQYGSTIRVETNGCIVTKPVETQAMPTVIPSPSSTSVFGVNATTEEARVPSSSTSFSLVSVPSAAIPTSESKLQTPSFSHGAHQMSHPPEFVPGPDYVPSNQIGISYSPYNDDSSCKTQDEVDSDFEKMTGYPLVRIYGVDCNQITTVTNAAKRHNMKLFAGINDLTDLPGSLKTLTEAVNGDWSPFDTISIGNELVNSGQNSPGDVINGVNTARQTLRAAGYKGPVVTVDTFDIMIKHPELCHASDYCAANCHAFYDSDMTAAGAGPYVKQQAEQVSKAAGGKRTVITESGWPNSGQANGAAVPSKENQRLAIDSLKKSFSDGGIILFTAFDDKWKQNNRWTYGAEQFWGIL
ncbi:hypothetical protein DTO207G8_2419 [Paecilomyces variotii]|nr:hypothetical protein DTO207G8_2419 [Paecilomyces variotii]KAJ9351810.1 hypothetical protein DTO027B9_6186 [Paecilomyces variotii]